MTRIALINPCLDVQLQQHRLGVGHLGLGYVAACLLQAGHDVRVIDAKTERLSLQATVDRVREYDPQIVGVTAMTHEIVYAAGICTAVKEILPDCLTLVGGPHSTALPEETIREFAAIDVAVRGEGERTACELAEALEAGSGRADFASIPGIAYRDSQEIHLTDERPFMTDLDALPFPAWELFPKNTGGWPVYAGRGCPFQCSFCQRVLGNKIRMRSVDNVMAEIEALEARIGQRDGWFQDETFGVNRKWTDEILDRMIERNARRGTTWHWKANSRANLADVELYRKMKRAGCTMLDFGVESGNEEILKRIHKSITRRQARDAIRAAKAAGLRTNAFFIIGHPGETWRTALQSVRFAATLGTDALAVGVMVPYPGTEIWELANRRQWGYRILSRDWRVYDKYFGQALELEALSHRQLEFLQSLTYLAFYLASGRVGELGRFVYRFRKEALRMVRRLVLPAPAAG